MFLILFLSQIRELKKSQDGDKMGEGMSFPSQHLTVCCWHVCMWVRDAKCWRQKSDVFISKMTHWACAANVLAVTSHQRDFRRKKKNLCMRENWIPDKILSHCFYEEANFWTEEWFLQARTTGVKQDDSDTETRSGLDLHTPAEAITTQSTLK